MTFFLEKTKSVNRKIVDNFCIRQENAIKDSCDKFARKQHYLIMKASKNEEDLDTISSIFQYHVVDKDLHQMNSKFQNITIKGKHNITPNHW